MRLYFYVALAAAASDADSCPADVADVSLLQLRTSPQPESGPSQLLRREAEAKPSVGIVGLGDDQFVKKYAQNVESMKCYAKKHGYDFVLINPADKEYKEHCTQYNVFFFKKHCLVATFLQRQPAGYSAFVMDLDVLVMRSDLPLDRWTKAHRDQDADLVFYERIWNPEVMAGNYFARSSNFSIHFLQHWASYQFRQPRGFSSADNGAIHLALMDALDLDRKKCTDLYHNLNQGVNDLNLDDPASEYWSFVRCTKAALHPPRRWETGRAPKHTGTKLGVITLLPKAHAWAVDGFVQNNQISRHEEGPVFYHGIKNMDESRAFFNFESCTARPDRVESDRHFTANFVQMLRTDHARGDERFLYTDDGVMPCVENLSCEPLTDRDGEEASQDGYPFAGEFVSLAPLTAHQ